MIYLIAILLFILGVIIIHYHYASTKPSYKCRHLWKKEVVWETKTMITHRYTCTNCGFHEEVVTQHLVNRNHL